MRLLKNIIGNFKFGHHIMNEKRKVELKWRRVE